MIEIRIDNQPVDLPATFTVDMEDTNPIFNDRGSQSVPATVPATRTNERLLSFPVRIDTASDPNNPGYEAVVSDGAYLRRGLVNVVSAGRTDGITFNIGFDNSVAYSSWSEKKLAELSTLPEVRGSEVGQSDTVSGLVAYLSELYAGAQPAIDPLAVFPVAVANESTDENDVRTIYWEVLNTPGAGGSLMQPVQVNRVVNNELTEVKVPRGYFVTAFVRVWKLLELVFADLGIAIDSNIFRTVPDFARLVVLNNAADAACTGVLRYADLMPDCTVIEFLNSLWVRFGLIYNINYETRTVCLALLRDILTAPAQLELLRSTSGPELINYEQAQYVRLSAKTSLEGAAPAVERFEDFIKGLDVSSVKLGTDVSTWSYIDNGDSGRWDGDVREEYPDPEDPDYPDPVDPDFPDPEDPDHINPDEGRETPDYYYSRAAAASKSADPAEDDTFLAREFVTGCWYKLDRENSAVRESSSSFFNWDPATPGLEALDLTSDDECVPLGRVNTSGLDTGNVFNGLCPAYLTGARHYHSYIKDSEDAASSGESTPLAFVLAFTYGGKTVGRISPEGQDGYPVTLDDGSRPRLSLLFQFKDGLFAQFWSRYDEILRHGNRTVEVPARLDKIQLGGLDMLRPVLFRGVRCLVDTVSYQLPAKHGINTDIKLRTITTHGSYNIECEQNIPSFSASARHLSWFLKSETYSGAMLNDINNRAAAALKYRTESGYQPYGVEGDSYDITAVGAVPVSMTRSGLTWQTDTSIAEPMYPGARNLRKYGASLTFDIYEVHYTSFREEEPRWELVGAPLARVTITVDYSVILVARWTSD